MKKYLKFASVGLAIIGVIMMFFTQVVVQWGSGAKETIGVQALVGGSYPYLKTEFYGVGAGLAGYILLAAGAVVVLLTVLVPYIREHDILSMVITGVGVICLIIGTILLFLIRKTFADTNGLVDPVVVYVGWGAIAGGSLGSLAAAAGALGMVFDLAGNN